MTTMPYAREPAVKKGPFYLAPIIRANRWGKHLLVLVQKYSGRPYSWALGFWCIQASWSFSKPQLFSLLVVSSTEHALFQDRSIVQTPSVKKDWQACVFHRNSQPLSMNHGVFDGRNNCHIPTGTQFNPEICNGYLNFSPHVVSRITLKKGSQRKLKDEERQNTVFFVLCCF